MAVLHAQLEVVRRDPVGTTVEIVTVLFCLIQFLRTNLIASVLTDFALSESSTVLDKLVWPVSFVSYLMVER